MSRRPPPPPPPPGGSSTTFGGSSSAGGYYSSNNAGSTSSTATQRLGLNNSSSNRRQQQQQQPSSITTTGGGGSSSTSDDWFASSSSAPSAPAPTPAPIAPNSGSGFYSSTTTTANDNNSSMYSTNNYGVNTNTNNNNPYAGGIGSATVSSSSNSGGGYYGGSMNTPTTAMSGAIGGGGGGGTTTIPSTSAFGSNPNSGSTGHIQGATTSSNSYELSGAIGAAPSSSSAVPTPHVFDPNAAAAAAKTSNANNNNNNMTAAPQYEEDYDNEPPLLEELGVNFPHIYSKSRAVVFPFGKHAKSLESGLIENDADLAGPLAFALGLGGELLLAGKMHFGYVYGFGLSGCFAMTLLLNLLNPNGAVSIWTVISILGYALLPVNLLAGVNALFRVHKLGVWGMVMAVLTIVWCTTASSRLFERGCNMRAQRFLLAYPTALLYSAFVMITIF